MKKTLSLLLALVMVIGLFPVFADEAKVLTAEEAGAILQGYGAIKGGSDGDLMIDKELKRQDAVIILTRLMGKEADAMATTAMPSFDDITIDYYKPFLAFAEAQKWIEGKGNNKFGFNDVVTVKEFAAMLLRALGHDTMGESYNKVMDLATDLKLFAGVEAQETTPVIRGAAFIMMNNTLETAPKGETRKLRSILGYKKGGALEVSSIKADSAKTIAVEFSREVVDEEAKELAFKVLRGKTDIKVDLTWNAENTIATLTNKNTFAVGDYTVTVMKGEEEFAKQDIKFEQQKVAKIEILSETVAVNPKDGKGYVVFRVYDQYEKDITEQHLGNALTLEVGVSKDVATKDFRNGVISITPAKDKSLLSFPQIPVTLYDRTSGVSVTKSLPTAAKIGSISEFKFMPEKDVVIVDGDLATTVVIPYEAIDQTGQKTTNYDLIKDGLILGGANNDEILTSMAEVKVRVMKDPKDGTKARIVAQFSGTPVKVNMDINVIVTALLWNGKNANMNITLKQANELHSFKLMSPSSVVAEGDKFFELPFEALDREGNRITKFYALNDKVSLTGGAKLIEKANGDAVIRVYNGTPVFKENSPIFITSTVKKTANFSQVQVAVQKAHEAKTLFIKDAGVTNALEDGLKKSYSFNYGKAIHIRDQYDRPRHLIAGEEYLKVESADPSVIEVTEGAHLAEYGKVVTLQTKTVDKEKSVEVTFTLYNKKNEVIEEKIVRFVVVPSKNITGYDYDPTTKAYANANDLLNLRHRDIAYGVDCGVTGRTDSGITNIELDNAQLSYTVGNPNEFVVDVAANVIVAAKPLNNKTESKTNVAVALTHNGNSRAYSYELTGTTELPEATGISFMKGTATHLGDDNYEISVKDFRDLDNKWLQKFYPKSDNVNYDNSTSTMRASIGFDADDSYAKGFYLGRLDLTYAMASENGKATVTKEGKLNTLAAKGGDVYRLTASSPKDGVSYTVKIFVKQDMDTKLEVTGVTTQPIQSYGDDVKVEVEFNRAVDPTSVTRAIAAKDVFLYNDTANDVAVVSALKDGSDKTVVVTIPYGSVKDNATLTVKKGIKVIEQNLTGLALERDRVYTLTTAPSTWNDTTPAPVVETDIYPEVTNIEVLPAGWGNTQIKLTFNVPLKETGVNANEVVFVTPAKDADVLEVKDNTITATYNGITMWGPGQFRHFKVVKTNIKNTDTTPEAMKEDYQILIDATGATMELLKPVSVKTIKNVPVSAVEVEVKFNNPVDETWAKGAGNIKVGNENTTGHTFTDGGKTVTFKFDGSSGDYADSKKLVMANNPKDAYGNVYSGTEFKYELKVNAAEPGDDTWTLE